jgi:hypothetical protein
MEAKPLTAGTTLFDSRHAISHRKTTECRWPRLRYGQSSPRIQVLVRRHCRDCPGRFAQHNGRGSRHRTQPERLLHPDSRAIHSRNLSFSENLPRRRVLRGEGHGALCQGSVGYGRGVSRHQAILPKYLAGVDSLSVTQSNQCMARAPDSLNRQRVCQTRSRPARFLRYPQTEPKIGSKPPKSALAQVTSIPPVNTRTRAIS